ncbi:hypothetical protein Patl1_18839 [Pistacia atlantica]|uniref:Uncharacterized protein n=1 Tax=Pistacia atlantica TaxID=434234 RepID=A0ACC1C167_9ROSI|nr:hypothetical protein Patl1_18839 [Pistacia atlantica]
MAHLGSTGKPESLWGKIDPRSFGDHAYRGRPPIRHLRGPYQPKTVESKAAYDYMLNLIQREVNGPPLNIADKILKIMKRNNVRDKKEDLEKFLNPVSNNLFHDLVDLAKDDEDEILCAPTGSVIANMGHIIERFTSLSPRTKMKGLLAILASFSEHVQPPIRPGKEEFSRQSLGGHLALDQQEILLSASRLLQAIVDVFNSHKPWLSLALLAMEASQMVTQGMWERDSMLLQLPHFTKDLAKKCQENPGKSIETVFDLVEMEHDERRELLQMSDSQLTDIAGFCNRFPNVDMSYEVQDGDNVRVGDEITLQVTLERDVEGRTEMGPVDFPRYPEAKEESWWLVVGDTKTNQ